MRERRRECGDRCWKTRGEGCGVRKGRWCEQGGKEERRKGGKEVEKRLPERLKFSIYSDTLIVVIVTMLYVGGDVFPATCGG